MATQENLDNESGSDKDDAEDEANVVVGLVALEASDAEPETDSEDEDEVYFLKFPEMNFLNHLKSFSHTLNTEPMS